MFGTIAAAAISGVYASVLENEHRQKVIAAAPPEEREAIRERFARRDHEARMEAIEQEKVRAIDRQSSSGFLPFIFGMVVGGSGK